MTDFERTTTIPDEIAILPLLGTVAYPQTIVPLAVGQPESIRLIDDLMAGQRIVGLMALKNGEERPNPVQPDDFYQLGSAAVVHKLMKLPDGTLRVVMQVLERIEIVEIIQTEPYYRAKIRVVPDQIIESEELEVIALMRSIGTVASQIAPLIPQFPTELLNSVLSEEDPRRLAYLVASYARMSVTDRQAILTEPSIKQKLLKLNEVLTRELNVLQIGQQIQSQVQDELGKSQREYVLREQLKAIRKELGETNEQEVEVDRLAEQIEAAGMSAEAHEQAMRELDRLRQMPAAAAEYSVIRSYLETLIALPWQKRSDDTIDVAQAAEILDADHYGLEEIKERILDYLAVRELRRKRSPERDPGRGAILCFVGPPGVGKTSLGRSIAKAMNREFVRLSLGGVHDEAEIRGHRRTYIGAMPGSLIQAIRRSGVNNPVVLLDEMDKLSSDHRGDPTSAMLEVLDPAQNANFRDHYLDVAWDLSPVMFIATANSLQNIPGPLRDRLEIIQLGSYTTREKYEIASRYLVPEQREQHSLEPNEVEISSDALLVAIEEYTREAGVRNLEQQIGTVMRKAARQVALGSATPIVVDSAKTREYLGKQRYFSEIHERTDRPGIVTGLVWTPVGGDIIFIEATKMTGRGNFALSGQLGDVMKESARAALSWVRAEGETYGIDPHFAQHFDLHVHVPAGAQPKDGPSAGIAMATALVSLLTGRALRDDVAMTGEITLRGKVLPIGGIREKVLAAHRAGIRTIILPQRNVADLDEIPAEVLAEMQFHGVEHVGQVIELALRTEPSEAPVSVPDHAVMENLLQPELEVLTH